MYASRASPASSGSSRRAASSSRAVGFPAMPLLIDDLAAQVLGFGGPPLVVGPRVNRGQQVQRRREVAGIPLGPGRVEQSPCPVRRIRRQ